MGLIVSHLVTMAKARSKVLCIFGVDNVEIISVDGSNLIFKGFYL